MDQYRTIRGGCQGTGLLSGYYRLMKMLYLAMMDIITKKWTGRRQDWSVIHAQLAIYYAGRMPG